MKFTLSWLKDHLDTTDNIHDIAETLINIGLEVEEIIDQKCEFIISQIKGVKPHPDADNLNICTVDNGKQTLQVICGAHNVKDNMKVVLATVGGTIPVNQLKIQAAKIRGITSQGMLCSAHELGIGKDHEGILELEDDKIIGTDFFNIDPIIDIAITPNRGDCLGVRGIARDLAAAGIGSLKPLIVPSINTHNSAPPINIIIEDTSNCSCLISCYIEGVNNENKSPSWMRERLKAIGINPTSTLVDITNYLTITLNRPMHIYDVDKLTGKQLIVKKSKVTDGEFIALNDKSYNLSEDTVVIADEKNPQAIAGIIGSKESGCNIHTKNILLEVASFNHISIGNSSRTLGITTDASYRFERGIDNNFIMDGAKIAIDMITSLCGGQPYKPQVTNNIKLKQYNIPFNLHFLEKINGLKIEPEYAKTTLNTLGFKIEGDKVYPPSWRHDITVEADLAEEILRVQGYNKIPSTPLPNITPIKNHKISSSNRDLLITQGMHEVITWSFMDSKKVISESHDLIKIKNPVKVDLDIMRPSIIPNLLEVMHSNFARDEIGVAIFEIGPIFYGDKSEEEVITGLRSGFNSERNIYKTERKYDIFDAKSDVLQVLSQYNINSPILNKNTPAYYHPGRSGCFSLGKTIIAHFGELLAQDKHRVVVFEIFIGRIPKIKKKKQNSDISIYQATKRDFAFVVKEEITIEEVLKIICKVDKNIIKNTDVFDIYRGKDIGENNKSIAISVKLQSNDKTLNTNEIERIHHDIIDSVHKKIGGILRKDYPINN